MDALNTVRNFFAAHAEQQPLHDTYSLTTLPLTAKVLSPKCLTNPFFLWAYRIISSPFILVTFLFDGTVGNLYRLILGNHLITFHDDKVVQEDQLRKNNQILIVAGAVAAAAMIMTACYYLSQFPNKDIPDPNIEHSIFTSYPFFINGIVFLGSACKAIEKKSPSYFIIGMSILALVNKTFYSPIGFMGTCTANVCSASSNLPLFLRPISLLTHFFEMHTSYFGILAPLSISFPAIFGKIGEWAGYYKPEVDKAKADKAAEAAKEAKAAPPAPTPLWRRVVSWIPGGETYVLSPIDSITAPDSMIGRVKTAVSESWKIVSLVFGRFHKLLVPLWVGKIITWIPIPSCIFRFSEQILVLAPFNRTADHFTKSVEKTYDDLRIRVATYALSAIYAIANATLMYNTITSCHTGLEVILSFATAWGVSFGVDLAIKKCKNAIPAF